MALNAKSFQLIEAKNAQSQRMRFMLAKLYGANLEVDVRGFLLQANDEEMACWLNIQKVFYATKGHNLRLQQLAENARLEHQIEHAYEQGRRFAYTLLPEDVAENGIEWRESKNPYQQTAQDTPDAVKLAWTAGFQNAFEIITAESW